MKQLFAVLPVVFLIGRSSLRGTPPDIVEIREILIGANGTVMALYEMKVENQGSHYYHGETLSLVVREIASGREVVRRVVRKVEFSYDFERDEFLRRVVPNETFDPLATFDSLEMTFALPAYHETNLSVENWALVLYGDAQSPVELISTERMMEIFSVEQSTTEIGESDSLSLVRVYTCRNSAWKFLELARENDDEVDRQTRIVGVRIDELSGGTRE